MWIQSKVNLFKCWFNGKPISIFRYTNPWIGFFLPWADFTCTIKCCRNWAYHQQWMPTGRKNIYFSRLLYWICYSMFDILNEHKMRKITFDSFLWLDSLISFFIHFRFKSLFLPIVPSHSRTNEAIVHRPTFVGTIHTMELEWGMTHASVPQVAEKNKYWFLIYKWFFSTAVTLNFDHYSVRVVTGKSLSKDVRIVHA